MNENPHRNIQNLPRIGPVFSSRDEKQRVIAEEILEGRIKPELKLKINMNILGLEKKKIISARNPETFRLAARMGAQGKDGWYYVMTSANASRFLLPAMTFIFYYFVASTPIMQNWQEREMLNYEYLTVYPKFQIVAPHYTDKTCFMA
jgi:hypothetical protein